MCHGLNAATPLSTLALAVDLCFIYSPIPQEVTLFNGHYQLTFTHESVRWTLSSDEPDAVGFSWAEALLKRWNTAVVLGGSRYNWFTLGLFTRADALQNINTFRLYRAKARLVALLARGS